MYLLKGADIYAPRNLGSMDVLVGGSQILAIAPTITPPSVDCQVIEADNLIAMPGMVDSLVHVSGGGGEGGYHTRTPEMCLSDATLAGVTTVVGALGTDGTTRSLADLLAKCRALENEGISAYCHTGSYQLPPRTLTGDVTDDIVLIDKFLGIGEVAIADHRGSQPDVQALAKVASDARVGGMLSGKSGTVCVHVGEGPSQLSLLHQVVSQTDVPASQFYPTHINRNASLLDAGIAWARLGGFIDMTTSTNQHFVDEGEIPAAQAVAYSLEQGVLASQVSMSSDGNASLPVFDQNGALIGLEVGKVSSLLASFRELVRQYGVALETAIECVSLTPANILGLKHKGRLEKGADADIVLLCPESLNPQHVLARGQLVVENSEPLVTGTFE